MGANYGLKERGGQFGIRCAIRLAMPLSNFMKTPLPAFLAAASVFVAGCGSLDNPFAGLFRTGRDARTYNAQTGDFEWPEDSSKPRRAAPGGAAAGAERKSDGRYFDSAKNQWVEAPAEGSSTSPSKPPASSPDLAAVPSPQPVAPPPPPPERASGIYNPSTGEIEWGAYDPAPPPANRTASRKRWWWPF